jgi:hypothetical protein
MEYESLVEKNVNRMMDKFFGDKDPALKTITKMTLLYDFTDESKNEIDGVLSKMKQINSYEEQCIKNELFLTYDKDGNIVSVNDIDESKDVFCEESKSEENPDFSPSNR